MNTMNTDGILQRLTAVLERRKRTNADESYEAGLYAQGVEKIIDKITEEAGETVAAARTDDTQHLIHEVADLWFHCLVLLAHKGTSYEAVLSELGSRFGTSGLVEKARRKSE